MLCTYVNSSTGIRRKQVTNLIMPSTLNFTKGQLTKFFTNNINKINVRNITIIPVQNITIIPVQNITNMNNINNKTLAF